LPYSYLNLGWAQLALHNYSAAEDSIEKASQRAPLDMHLLTALSYAQLMNHNYGGVIATVQQVHGRKHEGAAIVHYFAAAAWQGENNLQSTEGELQIFLSEAPSSPAVEAAREMIQKIEEQRNQTASPSVEISYTAAPLDANVATTGIPAPARRVVKQIEQRKQLAEVESEPEGGCDTCSEMTSPGPRGGGLSLIDSASVARQSTSRISPYTLRSSVNEVAVFFSATDNGKSVSDLTQKEVVIRDAGKPPANVTGFRNESELPLRLGLVIDTSNSIKPQFDFERKAAASFLKKSLTGPKDLAFVVGFSEVVLLVQDFTRDEAAIATSIDQLTPDGGTALWDAVKFAADKLANLAENKPVAKMLVVISDGEDNSSSATLREAIESAERHEITVYTVSTSELGGSDVNSWIGGRALKALSARSGGVAFFPDSLSSLDRRLTDLQEVIRSRYLISYKPDRFQADGSYRSISVVARKSGHKLRVYARRGYYAPSSGSVASR